MALLAICYLCGMSRTVRSTARGFLTISLLYFSSMMVISGPVSAATPEPSVTYQAIESLELLQAHHTYAHLFEGNNTIVYDVLKDKYKDLDHPESLARFADAFDESSSSFWRQYDIDKDNVMVVVQAVLIVVQNHTDTTLGSQGISGAYPYGYQLKTYYRDDGTLVTFDTDTKNIPSRMNWHFGDGTRYSCERDQCRRFNHLFPGNYTYTIQVFSALPFNNGERIEFDISL